jgi:hypothetical protein
MSRGEVKVRLGVDGKPLSDGLKAAEAEFDRFVSGLTGRAGSAGNVLTALGPAGTAAAAGIGAAAIAAGAAAAAIANATKAAVEQGGHLADLSAKTGVAAEALQRLSYGFKLAGGDINQVAGALVGLEKQLVKAPEAFAKLGLEADKLSRMAPDQALLKVGQAIQRIEDPAQRTAAAIATLGKAGAEALPALMSDLQAAGEKAQELGLVMSDATVAGLDATGDAADTLSMVFEGLMTNIGAAIATTPGLADAIEDVAAALGEMSVWVQQNSGGIQSFVQMGLEPLVSIAIASVHAIQSIAFGLRELGNAIADIVAATPGLQHALTLASSVMPGMGGLGGYGRTTTGPARASIGGHVTSLTPNFGGADKDIEKAAKEAEKLAAAIRSIDAEAAKLARNEGWAHLRSQSLGAFNATAGGPTADPSDLASVTARGNMTLMEMDRQRAEELKKQKELIDANKQATFDWAGAMQDLTNTFQLFGITAESSLAKMVVGFMSGMAGAQRVGAMIADLRKNLNMPNAGWAQMNNNQRFGMVSAGIGTLATAYGSGSMLGGAAGGAAMGAQIGSVIPGIGTAVGAIGGGLLGGLAGFFGGRSQRAAAERAEREQMDQMRAGFQETAEAARRAGIDVDAFFKARSPEQLQSAIDKIGGEFETLEVAQDKLRGAMDRYGFSIEEMGPKWAQQELDKKAVELLEAYKLLEAGGASVALIQERMSGDINEYVNQAIAAGSTIPVAWQGIIEQMIAEGRLLDENGVAYESAEAAGINFAETMTESMSRLVDEIERMVNALLGMPSEKTFTARFEREGDWPIPGEGGGGNTGTRGPVPYKEFAGGGLITRPTLSLMGEAGPEAVVPLTKPAEAASVMAKAGIGGTSITFAPTVNVYGAGNQAEILRVVEGAVVNQVGRLGSLVRAR